MRSIIFKALFMSMSLTIAVGNGIVINTSFYSTSLNETRWMKVYLPEGYQVSDTTRNYPLLIFLHGGYVTQHSYSMLITALDEQIYTGEGEIPVGSIQPMIAVLPDGNSTWFGGLTWWTNSVLNGQFQDYVVEDVIAYMDSAYNTQSDPDQRGIMGHSMGGYGAMAMALQHADVFRGVSTFGAVIDLDVTLAGITPWILDENGGSGPFDPGAGVWSEILHSLSAAFSPHIGARPQPVDLPIDYEGNRIAATWEQWVEHNPPALAAGLNPEDNMDIYTQCGINDVLWITANQAFSDSLTTLGIPHRLDVFDGDHNDALAQRIPFSLLRFDSLFNQTSTGIADENRIFPSQDHLRFFPNPANPDCQFSLPEHVFGDFQLQIFDIQGRAIHESMVEIQQGSPGRLFALNRQPSGIYLVYLSNLEGLTFSGRVTLLK